MKIKTQSVHFDADQKLLTLIDKKLGKLSNFYDRIIDADVTLRLERNGQVQDKITEIKLNLPGEVLVAKDRQKSFEHSAALAIDALKRQLIRHKEKKK